ncbi:uncharacterized protein LOC110350617 isoform X2 [Heterocephalus glaber]|uniref:Uncharacterized protein LOC110350617 isoform X2 n=1 Tax=Heterocephalus glaber TaxID=10181 RepID=A0AAX6TIK0_HETGA|nr:uncharacterized protein LOC110350617 isoform X2 [Heterocephalus glaber]
MGAESCLAVRRWGLPVRGGGGGCDPEDYISLLSSSLLSAATPTPRGEQPPPPGPSALPPCLGASRLWTETSTNCGPATVSQLREGDLDTAHPQVPAANDRKPQCLSSSGLRMLISLPAWPLPRGPKWLLISTLRKLKEEETKKRAASLSAHTPHSPTLEPAYSVAVVRGKSGLGAAWEPAVKSTGKEQEKTTRRQELRIAGLVRGLLTLCLVQ